MAVDPISVIQEKKAEWAQRNFGDTDNLENSVLGVCEEAGELAHALLKLKQGIRGDGASHMAELRDAIGDLSMYMMGVCSHAGWDFHEVIQETWEHISRRDWVANPGDGVTQ